MAEWRKVNGLEEAMSKKKAALKHVHYKLLRPVGIIGNPGTGKSTIGDALAKAAGLERTDIDPCIEAVYGGRKLQDIYDELGYGKFIRAEGFIARWVFDSHSEPRIYMPGGSFDKWGETVQHYKDGGTFFAYVQDDFDRIMKSIGRRPLRGIAVEPGKTLEQELRDRIPLFEHDKDITIHVGGDRHHAAKELFEVLLGEGIIVRIEAE